MQMEASVIPSHNYNIKNKKKNTNLTRCRDSRSAKSKEKGRDDSIKQFSTQLHPTYLSTVKDMLGGVVY